VPIAPTRFLPEWGGELFDPHAAIPSTLVAFALMIAVPIARPAEHRLTRVIWSLYPLLVTFVIISPANHFTTDAVRGAVTAALGAAAAAWTARARRSARASDPAEATA
jgi:PAP2 superfamily